MKPTDASQSPPTQLSSDESAAEEQAQAELSAEAAREASVPAGLSWLEGLGSAACISSALGLTIGVLGALGAQAGSPSSFTISAWILAGGSAALLLPLTASARGLLRQAEAPGQTLLYVATSLLLAAPILAVLFRVLKTSTNHRPLGAATFSVAALIVVLGLFAALGRLLALCSSPKESTRKSAKLALWALAALGALGALAFALPSASARPGYFLQALLVCAAPLAFGYWFKPTPKRGLLFAGIACWSLLVVGSGVLSQPETLTHLQQHAPVALGLSWVL